MPQVESTEKEQIPQTIDCKLPGLEGVKVTFDLMAPPAKVDNFVRSMGGKGSQDGIILSIEGWPADKYGPDPWDNTRGPGAWFAWVSRHGWATAMKAYLDDPNF